jgi:hypothetical protein
MKKIIFILFSVLLINCNKSISVKESMPLVVGDGYERQFGRPFFLSLRANDSLERDYLRLCAEKRTNEPIQESFFTICKPSVKDSVSFRVAFEQMKTGLCKDTIDIYINNTLLSTGEYPSNPQCRIYFPKLPKYVECTYVNNKKQEEASLLILFHNEKVYFDTIIPLRFREIGISHAGRNFDISFTGAIH